MDTSLVGESQSFRAALSRLERIAASDCPVLISGETGTGKELVAKTIHRKSSRCGEPFVITNCAAISPNLIESEFFGHERGAFTGARTFSQGKLAYADKGTIVLDEVSEMPLQLQAKLLRAVETGDIERVGSSKTICVDVRVIATTNRDLRAEVEAGRFRADLYFRLNVMQIILPPLRERDGDIVLLACFFLEYFSKLHKGKASAFSKGSLKLLNGYPWPGNVRELKHAVEKAVIFAGDGIIAPCDLEIPDTKSGHTRRARREAEVDHIRSTLIKNDGNVSKTARECGYTRKGLIYILNKHNIHPDEFRPKVSKKSPNY